MHHKIGSENRNEATHAAPQREGDRSTSTKHQYLRTARRRQEGFNHPQPERLVGRRTFEDDAGIVFRVVLAIPETAPHCNDRDVDPVTSRHPVVLLCEELGKDRIADLLGQLHDIQRVDAAQVFRDRQSSLCFHRVQSFWQAVSARRQNRVLTTGDLSMISVGRRQGAAAGNTRLSRTGQSPPGRLPNCCITPRARSSDAGKRLRDLRRNRSRARTPSHPAQPAERPPGSARHRRWQAGR